MTIENTTQDKISWVRLGAFIKDKRTLLKLNRREFELKSGVPSTTLSSIENGYTTASIEMLVQIATGLGIPVQSLFNVYAQQEPGVNYVLLPDGFDDKDIAALNEWLDMRKAWKKTNMIKKNSPNKEADAARAHAEQAYEQAQAGGNSTPNYRVEEKPKEKKEKATKK